MIFHKTPLTGCYRIEPEVFTDQRGWFARTFCKNEFKAIGHDKEWLQLNHSFTNLAGTIRGMHYQLAPFSEVKLVRCIAGKVFDVVVDLRKDSVSFLQWYGLELSAANKQMIYIPEGFAHGFQTLEDNTELLYHHTAFYAPGVEAGIRYDEPRINISWPQGVTLVSSRDGQHALLDENFKGI